MAKPRILLVEDEPPVVKMIRKRLEVAGYQVTVAVTGPEGLAQAQSERPDAVVLDLMLPGISGIDVCEAIKRDPRTRAIPVIVLTAKASDVDEQACRTCGADAYLTKPHHSQALIEQLDALLGTVMRRGAGPS